VYDETIGTLKQFDQMEREQSEPQRTSLCWYKDCSTLSAYTRVPYL